MALKTQLILQESGATFAAAYHKVSTIFIKDGVVHVQLAVYVDEASRQQNKRPVKLIDLDPVLLSQVELRTGDTLIAKVYDFVKLRTEYLDAESV